MLDKAYKLLPLLILPVLIMVTCTSICDPDIWFHIRIGKDLLLNHSVDWNNYYWSGVTENYSFLRYTFLGDIILYLIHFLGSSFGLVAFRCICVLTCLYCLWAISDKKITAWKVLLFIMLIIGTYQKQMVRNSMFALAFLPILLYLFENKKYCLMGGLVILWNFIHGSYLLGFSMLVILLASDAFDRTFTWKKTHINKYIIIILITFGVISIKNPLTTSTFTPDLIKKVAQSTPSNTVFQKGPGLQSIDFTSPFKYNRNYVRFSFVLGLITLCLVKPKRMIYIAPYVAICYIGMGYIRTVGYIPIISVFTLLKAEKDGNIRTLPPELLSLGLSLLIIFGLYTEKLVIRFPLSQIDFGKAIYYTDKVPAVAKRYKQTFTTMQNGGYLLSKGMRVSIDTNFAPHPKNVFDSFLNVRTNPDQLIKYCDSAVICINEVNYIQAFAKSKQWNLIAIDSGMVLFGTKKQKPVIMIGQEEIDSMAKDHRKLWDNVLRLYNLKRQPLQNTVK